MARSAIHGHPTRAGRAGRRWTIGQVRTLGTLPIAGRITHADLIGAGLAAGVVALHGLVATGTWYASGPLWSLVIGSAALATLLALPCAARPGPLAVAVLVALPVVARFSFTEGMVIAGGYVLGRGAARSPGLARGGLAFLVVLSGLGLLATLVDPRWPLGQLNHIALVAGVTTSLLVGLWRHRRSRWTGNDHGAAPRGERSGASQPRSPRPASSLHPGRRPDLGRTDLLGPALVALFAILLGFVALLERGQTALLLAALALLLLVRAGRPARLALIACLAGVGCFLGLTATGHEILAAVTSHPKIAARLVIYEIAWRGFLLAPLVGHGPWGMHHVQRELPGLRERFWAFEPTNLSHGHDLLLHALVQMGIAGTVLVAVAVAVPCWRAWRAGRRGEALGRVALWGFLGWAVIGLVSAAPWSEWGLALAGCLVGLMTSTSHRQARGPDATPAIADRLAAALGRLRTVTGPLLVALLVVFTVARPLAAQWSVRSADRLDRLPLGAVIWHEQSYNEYLNRASLLLLGSRRFGELATLCEELLERYGPRRKGWGRWSRAAYFAGDRTRALELALAHHAWHPLGIAHESERRHLARVLAPPHDPARRALLEDCAPDTLRTLSCLVGARPPRPRAIRAVLDGAREELTLPDATYLLVVGLAREDVDRALRSACLQRVLREYPQHRELRKAERKLRAGG